MRNFALAESGIRWIIDEQLASLVMHVEIKLIKGIRNSFRWLVLHKVSKI